MKKKKFKINLKPDQQITLLNNKSEYDIAKKDWGFYVTPSIQNRLKKFNLEAILVYKSKNYFLCLVKKNKKKYFKSYLSKEKLKLIKNLSTTTKFKKIFKKNICVQ